MSNGLKNHCRSQFGNQVTSEERESAANDNNLTNIHKRYPSNIVQSSEGIILQGNGGATPNDETKVDQNQNIVKSQELKSNKAVDSDAKLIGIAGAWYDVKHFIAKHPGGPIIKEFIGKDATSVFRAFHDNSVLKHRRPVGTYQRSFADPATKAFAELHIFFKNNGFFESNQVWFTGKFVFLFCIYLSVYLMTKYIENWFILYTIAPFGLFLFWQQAGFLMHDFMHSHGTQVRNLDTWIGAFCGTVCFGVSGHWWQDDHRVHHGMTNTVDYEDGFMDPQAHEDVWAQNYKLFPFHSGKIQKFLISIQHFTFLPANIFIGRFGIMLDSFKEERRWFEWALWSIHWLIMYILLNNFSTWGEAILFYYISSTMEGILHIQLLISHYSKPFHEKKDICQETEWYRMQIESNINIVTPWWMDWFHGGLNFHIEHHLYPMMPRHNYRSASKHIQEVCKRLNIVYDEEGWFEAVANTLKSMKKMSHHYTLDPR
ncbi:unnamed protein product [Owenia fusiformis]|uniref:Cytochrome b5 heme-binding domain-containing protein n=1 Tax=Owenia fusiformis TaxID=6347 RepID=A0A8S4N0S6_OWEFU|nr:unnamed protein product [Owenia fusiformis]